MLNKTDISVLYINYNYKKMKLINSPIYTLYKLCLIKLPYLFCISTITIKR